MNSSFSWAFHEWITLLASTHPKEHSHTSFIKNDHHLHCFQAWNESDHTLEIFFFQREGAPHESQMTSHLIQYVCIMTIGSISLESLRKRRGKAKVSDDIVSYELFQDDPDRKLHRREKETLDTHKICVFKGNLLNPRGKKVVLVHHARYILWHPLLKGMQGGF